MNRPIPLNIVTFIFGTLSIPLAFLRHLCSLAVVIGFLAIAFALWGNWYSRKYPDRFSMKSLKRMRIGGYAGAIGLLAGIVMWILWASNFLLR